MRIILKNYLTPIFINEQILDIYILFLMAFEICMLKINILVKSLISLIALKLYNIIIAFLSLFRACGCYQEVIKKYTLIRQKNNKFLNKKLKNILLNTKIQTTPLFCVLVPNHLVTTKSKQLYFNFQSNFQN